MKIKTVFPCGLMIQVDQTSVFRYIDLNTLFSDTKKNGCPLHGKECNKQTDNTNIRKRSKKINRGKKSIFEW